MGHGMIEAQSYTQPKLFPLSKPLRALTNATFLGICTVLIVLGTYGTFDGGKEVADQRYLQSAFPAAVAFLSALFLWMGFKRGKVTLYALQTHEGLLLLFFYILAFFSLLFSPEKLAGTLAAATASIVTVLLVTNRVTSRARFTEACRFLCALIYFISLMALLSGAYTFWIGSFTVGPLLIEYNKIFWRVNSWFITSTAFGVFLAYGIIAAFYFIATSPNWLMRSGHWLVIAGFVVGMGLSGARTCFGVLAFAMLVLAATRLSLRKSFVCRLGLGLMLLMVAIWLIGQYGEEIYILRRFLGAEDAGTLGGRSEMWQEALRSWYQLNIYQVLFGSGLGTFSETMDWSIGAHSGMLRIFIEHGSLGLAVFLTLMSLTLWRVALAVHRARQATPEMIVVLLFVSLFFSAEIVIQQLMGISMDYLLFLVVLALHLSSRRLRLNQPPETS
jgi:hypothetical protein